ncbi:MAG: hypothetical protein L6R39_000339 [Caloplaca ligustica]|nr:MAG: hypothetical protein L6R39_000339 [Caloplaca ligustica]
MTSRLTQPAVVATSVPVPSTQAVGSPSPDNAVPSAPGLGAAHLPSPGSESLPGANPSESVSEESSIKDPSSFVAYSNGGFNRASDIPTTAEVITHPDAGLGGVADSHTTQQKGNPTWPTFPVLQPTTVAGVAVKEDSKSQYFIGSQTQTAGAPGITINGTLVSLVPSATALVIGTSTALLAVAPTQDVITLNGLSFTRGPGSNLVIGTYIVRPGALAITVSGRPVSLAIDATALVVGSSTTSLAISPMQAILTANGLTFTRGHGSGLVVGTQTITPGASAVMISGRPVSLAIDATALVVDSSTTSLGISPMQDVLTVNGLTFARGPGSVLAFGTQTIIPGAPAVTISGLSVSLAPSGTATVVSGSTNLALNTKTTPAVLQVEGKSFTVGPGSDLVIGSQTLIPGASAIAIDGTPISLAVGGTALVLGDSTVSVPGSSSTTPVVLDINGASLTEVSGSNFVYGSQTLIPGGSEITLSGTPVSLGTGALDLLLGTQRETLTTSQGLGGIILAGLGSGGPGVPQATSVELHQQVMRKRQATF